MTKEKMIPTKKIIKFGYEYTLVVTPLREASNVPEPHFMGFQGYALQSVKKIKTK